MNIPEPKFKLWDWVDVPFKGELEGEPVSVTKRLLIVGITAKIDKHNGYVYRLVDGIQWNKLGPYGNPLTGKAYDNLPEESMIPTEPVINEILKANT